MRMLSESLFTAVLVGFFSLMGLVPWPGATTANLVAIAFLQLLGMVLGRLKADVHLSPAVTVMLVTSGKLQPGEALQRLFAQLICAPFLLLYALSLAGKTTLGDLSLPVPSGAPAWIVAVEGVATFVLLILIFKSGSALAADVGGTIIGGVLCPTLPFAASMNPAMTTFAALITGSAAACALALVGSLSAAVSFGLLDRCLRHKAEGKLKHA